VFVARNPFKPSFGISPPIVAGRQDLIDEFETGLLEGPGAPSRATVYEGLRGIGKTVMLNEVSRVARGLGWVIVSETLTPGFLERIIREHLPLLLQQFDGKTGRHFTGLTAPLSLGGVTWENAEKHPAGVGLRSEITELAALVKGGILFTLDELHRTKNSELLIFCAEIQQAFREELSVAFVGAGLPVAVDELLAGDDTPITFLRRAERPRLGTVDVEEVRRALRTPIESGGRQIGDEALELAVAATQDGDREGGYPFLIQLVGYNAWNQHRDRMEITTADVEAGISVARRKLGTAVLGPILSDLPAVQRTFLLAMAHDDGPSKMKDIGDRLQVSKNYASQYRLRLIEAGVIAAIDHGQIDFTLPQMRDYLRTQAAFTADLMLTEK
jgi:hypothetical protein